MRVSLVNALAKHLNVDETEAADALRSVVSELRRALEESDRIDVPAIGSFFRQNGGIGFEPDDALLQAANLDTEGLGVVTLPGRTDVTPPAAVESAAFESAADDEPAENLELEGPPSFAPEPDVPEDLTGVDEESPAPPDEDEVAEFDRGDVALFGPETDDEPAAPVQPPDPVTYWNEEEYDAEEADESTVYHDEFGPSDGDEADDWQQTVDETSALGVAPAEESIETADFTVVPGEADQVWYESSEASSEETVDETVDSDEPGSVAPPAAGAATASAAATPHHPSVRADRPPERHAEPHEVRQERPARRRSMVPILLVGAVLLLGLAAAAYYMLLQGPDADPIAAREMVESPRASADGTTPAGGLADSAVIPATGAAEETVTEAEEQPTAAPEEPATASAPAPDAGAATGPSAASETGSAPSFAVADGGWTVVVGSATTPAEAFQIVDRFRGMGLDAVVLYGAYGGVTRYRVVVDQFATEAEAQRFLREAPEGLPSDAWRLPVSSDLEVISR